MQQVVVVGGGFQGRIIASDLAKKYAVTIVDRRELDSVPTCVTFRQLDFANSASFGELLRDKPLVVGALPSTLGFQLAQACVEHGCSFIDIAFATQDYRDLHDQALASNCTVIADAGLAPGLSNLLVGRGLTTLPDTDSVVIMVGGVAATPDCPFGYRVTWNVEDLLEEYTRPARIRRDGEEVEKEALSELEVIDFPGLGKLESFLTDGLRSLLSVEGPSRLEEKTLRWPGHVAEVSELLEAGEFVPRIRAECQPGDDVVALLVRFDERELTCLVRAEAGLSAMARSTALTCTGFVDFVLSHGWESGVFYPEDLGRSLAATEFILEHLRRRGVQVELPEWLK